MFAFKHLLIDGWNAIHSHTQLRHALETDGWQAARSMLWGLVAPIHDFGGSRVTIVYDGQGEDISIERPTDCPTFSEVFTSSDMTADEFIEQYCANNSRPNEIMVATRDNMIHLTSSSFGAFATSVEDLFSMAATSAADLNRATRGNNRKNSFKWRESNPFNSLDCLAVELKSAFGRPALISKRLKKKLKKASNGDENKK